MLSFFMMRKKSIFSLLLSMIAIGSLANVVVNGKAEDIKNESVYFFAIDDYLTGHRTLLATQAILSDGTFHFEWNTPVVRELIVTTGYNESSFFVEPNGTYTILVRMPKTSDVRRFDRNPLELVIEQEPTSALNFHIESFDADYSKFISEHFYDFAATEYRGSEVFRAKQSEKTPGMDMYKRRSANRDSTLIQVDPAAFGTWVMKFEKAVSENYSEPLNNPFFSAYTRYHIAQLEMWSGISRAALYTKYLHSNPVLFYNPAYTTFFDVYYHDIFATLRKQKSDEVVKLIETEREFGKLQTYFASDSLMLNQEVRELAMLKALREAYFSNSFSKSSTIATIKSACLVLKDTSMCKVAKDMEYVLRVGKKGWETEDFTLLDERDDKWRLDEQRAKFIYIIFFSAESASSQKELQLLENLQANYAKSIDIVAINMDQDYSKFKKHLATHRNQKFTFLSGKGDPLLTQKFNIRSLPHAVMLDPNHKVLFDYTKRPSEGIAPVWDSLITQTKKGGKSWKD
jgi:peroxiredoxin